MAALGTNSHMSSQTKCPKCGSELGLVVGMYCCWNQACGFRSYRPWIAPPSRSSVIPLPEGLELVIGQCLNAAANGPFFVDSGAKDNPYWEYQSLLGFSSVRQILCFDVSDTDFLGLSRLFQVLTT